MELSPTSGATFALYALITLVSAGSLGCVIERNGDSPRRPPNISADAAWIGGPDGGVWVQIRRTDSTAGLYQAKIQYESGAVAYEGPMRRHPPSDSVVDSSMIEAWDGDELLLTGGGSLRTPD